MGNAKSEYIIDGKVKSGSKLVLSDVVYMFDNFVKANGHYPSAKECVTKNNLPHSKILAKILNENKITLNDWQTRYGKYNHIRSCTEHYNDYIEKYKIECDKINRPLLTKELVNNNLGLPSANWLVDNCPDKTVNTYDDFVQWCGYSLNKPINTRESVSKKLIELQHTLTRPITKNDISEEKVGFSMIVINRLWGNLTNAKKEIGLRTDIIDKHKPFDYYKEKLDYALENIYNNKQRKTISWDDLENSEISGIVIEHRTIKNAFDRAGLDFYAYIQEKGFTMLPSSCGYISYFEDGELARSIYEHDFSTYIRNELKLKYKTDYFRDVMYSQFSNETTKINCDYCFNINGEKYYVEITGLIYNTSENNWREKNYNHKRVSAYKNKMIEKEKIFIANNCNYLFIFANDMTSNHYKKMVADFLKIREVA